PSSRGRGPPRGAAPTPPMGRAERGGTRAPLTAELLPVPGALGEAAGPHQRMSERACLREVQYRDDTNLNARAAPHKRFSVNPVGLQRWLLDLLDLPAQAGVLEVGCGPGDLWVANLDRIPPGWRVVLSDFSPGMVEAARRRLGSHRFDFEVADAEAVPHGPGAF